MTIRGRDLRCRCSSAIATAFGVSSTIQAYWLSRVAGRPRADAAPPVILNTGLLVRPGAARAGHHAAWPPATRSDAAGGTSFACARHRRARLLGRPHVGDARHTRVLMPEPPPSGWWFVTRIEYLTTARLAVHDVSVPRRPRARARLPARVRAARARLRRSSRRGWSKRSCRRCSASSIRISSSTR